eukprot:scaffold39075_cov148-Skeletonema_marinoi.AAC.1
MSASELFGGYSLNALTLRRKITMPVCVKSLQIRQKRCRMQKTQQTEDDINASIIVRYDMVWPSKESLQRLSWPHQVTYDVVATPIRPTNT